MFLKKIKTYWLEFVVFFCGAIVMIYELVGSRILGPYLGTSLFVWTSLIGIILGSLSFGYHFGGRMADKKLSREILGGIIFLSAVFVLFTFVSKDFWLNLSPKIIANLKINAIVSSIILFAPTSFLLGMVSPYAVKLKLNDWQNSGQTIGNLYAISTAGSIFGTFISGFWLIPTFGTDKIILLLTGSLFLLSIPLTWKNFNKIKLFFFSSVIVLGLLWQNYSYFLQKINFIDTDTAYNRVWIYDHLDENSGKKVRRMGINNENHSSMFVDNDDLVNEYTKYYHLARYFFPDFKKTLMFGGAGYSFPKNFLLTYPDSTIDVVEIDPGITALAKKYFRLPDEPRLKIIHEDGRVFLNKTTEKYDLIFGDAFASRYSIPYQLTTIEAVKKEFNLLNENGAVILNIISSINNDSGKFLRAEYATYQKIFPKTYLFAVSESQNGERVQNLILVATKNTVEPTWQSSDKEIARFLQNRWTGEIALDTPILTDDFAPVDNYINEAL
ncbi:MAG: fused MFS/spermidine synthase [Patescibacteria group bacterium]